MSFGLGPFGLTPFGIGVSQDIRRLRAERIRVLPLAIYRQRLHPIVIDHQRIPTPIVFTHDRIDNPMAIARSIQLSSLAIARDRDSAALLIGDRDKQHHIAVGRNREI